jgi:hypothetical protein
MTAVLEYIPEHGRELIAFVCGAIIAVKLTLTFIRLFWDNQALTF